MTSPSSSGAATASCESRGSQDAAVCPARGRDVAARKPPREAEEATEGVDDEAKNKRNCFRQVMRVEVG